MSKSKRVRAKRTAAPSTPVPDDAFQVTAGPVPDPVVRDGAGNELRGSAKAEALTSVFGNMPMKTMELAPGLKVAAPLAPPIAETPAPRQSIFNPGPVEREVPSVHGLPTPATRSLNALNEDDARIMVATAMDREADRLAARSEAAMASARAVEARLGGRVTATSEAMSYEEAKAELARTQREIDATEARQRALMIDRDLLELIQSEGGAMDDPRLALLSAKYREKVIADGGTISPEAVAAVEAQGDEMRLRLAEMFLGRDDALKPVPGNPRALSVVPYRVIATGDLRAAQRDALILGAPSSQMLDVRLDTLLDGTGAHLLVATDLLDEDADLERPHMVDGDEPRAMSVTFVRCRIWCKIAFNQPQDAVMSEVTLPVAVFMQALPVRDARLPKAYDKTIRKAKALGAARTTPLFQITLQELMEVDPEAAAEVPQFPLSSVEVAKRIERMEQVVSGQAVGMSADGITMIPQAVLDSMPEQSRAALLRSNPDLQIL